MKREVRCPKDQTLLVSFEDDGKGQTAMQVPEGGRNMKSRRNPQTGRNDVFFICPACATETYAFSMDQPANP